jgi:hypothetical protein
MAVLEAGRGGCTVLTAGLRGGQMKIKIRPYEASSLEEDWLATGDWLAELRAIAEAARLAEVDTGRPAGTRMAPLAAWRTS